jgi:hypothetical protein
MSTMPMRVLVEKFLRQGLTCQNQTLKYLSVNCAWVLVATSYRNRPLGGTAFQGPGLGHLPGIQEPLGMTIEEGCNVPGRKEVPK